MVRGCSSYGVKQAQTKTSEPNLRRNARFGICGWHAAMLGHFKYIPDGAAVVRVHFIHQLFGHLQKHEVSGICCLQDSQTESQSLNGLSDDLHVTAVARIVRVFNHVARLCHCCYSYNASTFKEEITAKSYLCIQLQIRYQRNSLQQT